MSYKSDKQPSHNGIRNDLNVIPLIDIMLVLLVIFMIAMPSISKSVSQRDTRLELTQASEKPADSDQVENVVIHSSGKIIAYGQNLSLEQLQQQVALHRGTHFRVQAQGDVTYRQLKDLLAVLSADTSGKVELSGEVLP